MACIPLRFRQVRPFIFFFPIQIYKVCGEGQTVTAYSVEGALESRLHQHQLQLFEVWEGDCEAKDVRRFCPWPLMRLVGKSRGK